MKFFYTILLMFTTNIIFSQIPTGYYNSATGLTGYALKTQLYNIIKDHTDRSYAGLYTTYTTSDIDLYYENNGTALDMYTENPTGPDLCEYTYGINQDPGSGGTYECHYYNREHIIPQSVFSDLLPMKSDAHFVTPSDKFVNSQRGILPFGKVNVPNWTSSNGSKRGSNLNSGYSAGYSGDVFEPIDEFKGDIARMFLYFATRYENLVAGWNYDMFNNTSNQVFTPTFRTILLTWHNQDPVSQRERDRNNAIFIRQTNRNPYIDHPEYVASIWGNVAAIADNELMAVRLYPNPASNYIFVEYPNDIEAVEYEVYTVLGQKIDAGILQNEAKINVVNLVNGMYILHIFTENASKTEKFIIEK